MSIYQRILAALFLLLALEAMAVDTRPITTTQYSYDASGNINAIATEASDQAPLVTDLIPSRIRIGQQLGIIAEGSGLLNVQISVDTPGLIVSNIQSLANQAEFTLSADAQASVGEHTLSFSTTLGDTTHSIIVDPPLPIITLNPAPVLLPLPGAPVPLDIQLTSVDVFEHTLNLIIDDPDIATSSSASVTIPAGQTRPSSAITLSGLQKGGATLSITSPGLADINTRIFVTDPFNPAIGNHTVFAQPLGVVREQAAAPPPTRNLLITSSLLGIVRESTPPSPPTRNLLITSPLLGIVRETAPPTPPTRNLLITSPLLGIVRESTPLPPPMRNLLITAPLLGIAYEPTTP